MNNRKSSTTTSPGALFALATLVTLCPLAALASDPSLSDVEVQTPCGTTTQISGAGVTGKEGCSGNLLTSFPVGPITLSYNSQYETYSATSTTRRPPSYGFGRGMTAFSELVRDGIDFKLRLNDGTIKHYTEANANTWISADKPLGDTSVIKRPANASQYELRFKPSNEKIVFKDHGGFRLVPIQHTTEGGLSTDYSYPSADRSLPAIPSTITERSTGKKITLQLSDDKYVVTSITDDRGRTYTLSYSGAGANRLLTGITLPDRSSYTLGYEHEYSDTTQKKYLTSVKDPLNQYTFYSFFKHGRLKAVGTSTGSVSNVYTANSITTQSLSKGVTPTPLQFKRTLFDASGYASEFRSGDGAPSSSVPGMLLGKLTHDPIGRVTSATDQLGNTTRLYYNADGSCSSSNSSRGTSPLPTCSVSNGVQITTTRNIYNLPTSVIRRDPSGNSSTMNFTWGESGRMTAKTITDTQGRTTFNKTVGYQGSFASDVTVKTTQFIDAYDELGRVLRTTDSSGIESSYTYNQNGSLNTVTSGGVTTTMTQNISGDGSATWSVSGPGGQQAFTSNFLGTQSSSTLSSAATQLSLSTSSVVEPGIGTMHGSTTNRMSGPGGKLTSLSTGTSNLTSNGDSSSTSESSLNIN